MADLIHSSPHRVRFGSFEVDLRAGELWRAGRKRKLTGQPFLVLAILLERPGEVVSREELQQRLWPDTFVDVDHNLNAAVNRIREALDDSAEHPRFVETLPRRGYRFIAPVDNGESEAMASPATVPAPLQNGLENASTVVAPLPAPKRHWMPAVLALLLLLSVGALLFIRSRNRQSPGAHPESQQDDLRVVPLTTLPGMVQSPSFSPDGSQVVFAWDGGNSNATDPFNLYVKVIGSENIERLTNEPARWIVPAWSPDGSTIAFARAGGPNPGIFSVPARGGAEKKLANATFPYAEFSASLSWSSDGHQLTYYSAKGLLILTLETGEVRPVDTPGCDAAVPAFSPDGKWIATVCGSNSEAYINLLSVEGGPSRHLAKGVYFLGLAWSPDSQRVIFSPINYGLEEVNINDGALRNLAFANGGYEPAVSPRGSRLAFVKGDDRAEIWRVDTRTGLVRSAFFPASVEQMAPDISPDGKRIAFESERSGFHEVWVANLDGSDAVRLSNFHVLRTGTPRWSPDGHRIVFDSTVSGKPALYLVDPSTALPKQISTNNLPASVPSWSPDGKWIYFTSESAGTLAPGSLYRVSPEGGTPEQVTQTRGYNAKQSKDGRFLYFFAGSQNAEIHVLDLASGHEQALPGMPRVLYPTDWTLGSKGIFFVDWNHKPSIDFYDFGSQRVTHKIPLNRQPSIWGGLSLSPDETWLAYSQVYHRESDLMLVEGFK